MKAKLVKESLDNKYYSTEEVKHLIPGKIYKTEIVGSEKDGTSKEMFLYYDSTGNTIYWLFEPSIFEKSDINKVLSIFKKYDKNFDSDKVFDEIFDNIKDELLYDEIVLSNIENNKIETIYGEELKVLK